MKLFNKIKNFFHKLSNKHSKIKRLEEGKTKKELKNGVLNLDDKKENFIKDIKDTNINPNTIENKPIEMKKQTNKDIKIIIPPIIGDGTGIKKINL